MMKGSFLIMEIKYKTLQNVKSFQCFFFPKDHSLRLKLKHYQLFNNFANKSLLKDRLAMLRLSLNVLHLG